MTKTFLWKDAEHYGLDDFDGEKRARSSSKETKTLTAKHTIPGFREALLAY